MSDRYCEFDPEDEQSPADTMAERRDEHLPVSKLLVDANRYVVAAFFVLALLVSLLVLGWAGPTSTQKILSTGSVGSLFGSIIIVVVTVVALVLTITQLVISQEVDPLGAQHQKLANEIVFRDDVETLIDSRVSPAEPARFARALVETGGDHARRLAESDAEAVARFGERVADHSETISDELNDAEFGTFEVLEAILDYNYSWKTHTARRLIVNHEDDLSAEEQSTLDELIHALRAIATTREYVKTLYFQWEAASLATAVVYVSIPTLAVAAYMTLAFEATPISGRTIGLSNVYLSVVAATGVAVAPLMLLLSHLLRLVTIAKRTLAVGPFILRETTLPKDE
jgi:hypothetical protein